MEGPNQRTYTNFNLCPDILYPTLVYSIQSKFLIPLPMLGLNNHLLSKRAIYSNKLTQIMRINVFTSLNQLGLLRRPSTGIYSQLIVASTLF